MDRVIARIVSIDEGIALLSAKAGTKAVKNNVGLSDAIAYIAMIKIEILTNLKTFQVFLGEYFSRCT